MFEKGCELLNCKQRAKQQNGDDELHDEVQTSAINSVPLRNNSYKTNNSTSQDLTNNKQQQQQQHAPNQAINRLNNHNNQQQTNLFAPHHLFFPAQFNNSAVGLQPLLLGHHQHDIGGSGGGGIAGGILGFNQFASLTPDARACVTATYLCVLIVNNTWLDCNLLDSLCNNGSSSSNGSKKSGRRLQPLADAKDLSGASTSDVGEEWLYHGGKRGEFLGESALIAFESGGEHDDDNNKDDDVIRHNSGNLANNADASARLSDANNSHKLYLTPIQIIIKPPENADHTMPIEPHDTGGGGGGHGGGGGGGGFGLEELANSLKSIVLYRPKESHNTKQQTTTSNIAPVANGEPNVLWPAASQHHFHQSLNVPETTERVFVNDNDKLENIRKQSLNKYTNRTRTKQIDSVGLLNMNTPTTQQQVQVATSHAPSSLNQNGLVSWVGRPFRGWSSYSFWSSPSSNQLQQTDQPQQQQNQDNQKHENQVNEFNDEVAQLNRHSASNGVQILRPIDRTEQQQQQQQQKRQFNSELLPSTQQQMIKNKLNGEDSSNSMQLDKQLNNQAMLNPGFDNSANFPLTTPSLLLPTVQQSMSTIESVDFDRQQNNNRANNYNINSQQQQQQQQQQPQAICECDTNIDECRLHCQNLSMNQQQVAVSPATTILVAVTNPHIVPDLVQDSSAVVDAEQHELDQQQQQQQQEQRQQLVTSASNFIGKQREGTTQATLMPTNNLPLGGTGQMVAASTTLSSTTTTSTATGNMNPLDVSFLLFTRYHRDLVHELAQMNSLTSSSVAGGATMSHNPSDSLVSVCDVIDLSNETTLTGSHLNNSLPIKIIIHGFGSGGRRPWVTDMVYKLLEYEDVNVIVVDWERGATLPNYVQAAGNTRVVGHKIAQLIKLINAKYGLTGQRYHMIGFSLGAHVAGFAGMEIRNSSLSSRNWINRITGLDPASPLFEGYEVNDRLDPSDAQFVDVIHSNGDGVLRGGFGSLQPMGHVDFYPNGGRVQVGCNSVILSALSDIIYGKWQSLCNHRRALNFFMDSFEFNKCRFRSFNCDSYENYLKGECFDCGHNNERCSYMGYSANLSNGRGKMYLTTHEEAPFCANQFTIKIIGSKGYKTHWGKVEVTLVTVDGKNESFWLSSMNSGQTSISTSSASSSSSSALSSSNLPSTSSSSMSTTPSSSASMSVSSSSATPSSSSSSSISSSHTSSSNNHDTPTSGQKELNQQSMQSLIVAHPTLGNFTQILLRYTKYKGWIYSGDENWPIDKVFITDSDGQVKSFCGHNTILESHITTRLNLESGNCTMIEQSPSGTPIIARTSPINSSASQQHQQQKVTQQQQQQTSNGNIQQHSARTPRLLASIMQSAVGNNAAQATVSMHRMLSQPVQQQQQQQQQPQQQHHKLKHQYLRAADPSSPTGLPQASFTHQILAF